MLGRSGLQHFPVSKISRAAAAQTPLRLQTIVGLRQAQRRRRSQHAQLCRICGPCRSESCQAAGAHQILSKNGGTFGFSSFVGLEKSQHRGVVVLANSHDDLGVNEIGYALLASDRNQLDRSKPAEGVVKMLDRKVGEYELAADSSAPGLTIKCPPRGRSHLIDSGRKTLDAATVSRWRASPRSSHSRVEQYLIWASAVILVRGTANWECSANCGKSCVLEIFSLPTATCVRGTPATTDRRPRTNRGAWSGPSDSLTPAFLRPSENVVGRATLSSSRVHLTG
jgi:hypothetical protein